MQLRVRTALVALALAATLGGCGLGSGRGSGGASVLITSGFGVHQVGAVASARTPGSETVMRMLERSFHVQTRYGGGFVQAINGLAGDGARTDWFYYVNGVQARQGAATTAVHRGDHVWWDLHDWRATNSVPAVVGSFPEPFVDGVGGKRYPTTVECAANVGAACQQVTQVLSAVHVPVANQLIGTGSGPDTLGVVVGTWKEVAPEVAGSLLAHGPGASGVYARFAAARGGALQLLDPSGQVARTLGPGAGLIAATADSTSAPTWLITGTDVGGVTAAAHAFNTHALYHHFALAVQGSSLLPVPLQAGR